MCIFGMTSLNSGLKYIVGKKWEIYLGVVMLDRIKPSLRVFPFFLMNDWLFKSWF